MEEYKIKEINFNKNNLIEFEVKNLSFIKKLPSLFSYTQKADFYQFILVEKGEVLLTIDFQEIILKQNQAVFIVINQAYKIETFSEYKGKMILFTKSFFYQAESDGNFLYNSNIFNPIKMNQKIEFSQQYIELLFGILNMELGKSKNWFYKETIQNILKLLLLESERLISSTEIKQEEYLKFKKNTVKKFFNLVENNFKQKKQANFYVKQIAISEKSLNHQVKEFTGITIKQYINDRLILEAKRLLSYSDLTIKEISFELGWDETTNFNKFFKKYMKMTPLEFRKDSLKI